MDIWFGSDREVCFWSCGTRAQITWAGLATVHRRSRLFFTQYGIYMELFLLFWLFWLSRVLGTSTCLGGTNVVRSRGTCMWPKQRNISIAIQDTYTLSSSVNKCITICTPSIHWLYRLANPTTIYSHTF